MPSSADASDNRPRVPLAHPEAFAEPEKLLRAYFNSPAVGLFIVNAHLQYLAVNETLAQMHGIPAEDHIGKTVREILGDFADVIEPQLGRVLSTGEPVHFELSGGPLENLPAGHWRAHYLPIKDDHGVVDRIGAIVNEISGEKRLQESLEDTNRKLSKEVSKLDVLLDVTNLLSENWDLQKVFPQISARIRRVLHQEFAGFALHDPATGFLVRQAMDFPLGKGLMENAPVSPSDSPGGHVLHTRTAKIFSQQEMASFDSPIAKGLVAEGLQSLCCMPLLRPNGPLGVLVLGSTRENAFQPDDLTLLNHVATQFAIALENHRSAKEIEALKQRLSVEQKHLEGEVRGIGVFREIVGVSPVLLQVLEQVAVVAPSDATVLILGETGTGKELIAHAIHRLSLRKDGPFIKVNCAAIPTGLLESELFGHEKGAFTGAVSQKIGRMELADGGTLFLDEVGEIPLDLQPKLLRVLQDQEFERLGGTKTIKAKVRIVAATNRDLARGVAQHEFRTDLFYRLNVFPVRIPALRERPEDIPLLVRHFVRKFALRMNRHIETVPSETIKLLSTWVWPGNVRELENLIERSVILSEGRALHVPLEELRAHALGALPQTSDTLNSAERDHIIRVLRETNGVISGPDGAATRLGLKRTTLQSKMQRLGIQRSDYSK